jgi:hypothetical protein
MRTVSARAAGACIGSASPNAAQAAIPIRRHIMLIAASSLL